VTRHRFRFHVARGNLSREREDDLNWRNAADPIPIFVAVEGGSQDPPSLIMPREVSVLGWLGTSTLCITSAFSKNHFYERVVWGVGEVRCTK
jgi:hypothetical protein